MIRVLLVDDHLVVRKGVRLMIDTTDDITIAAEAGSARDALLLLQQQEFDVALVDIALPDKSGLELLKSMKAKKPQMAILMLSMYSEDVYAVRALKIGAAGYLNKNASTSTVLSAIRKAAAGGKHISPSLVEIFAGMLAGESMPSHEALSDRELEVLKMIAAGTSLARIAEALHLSPNTVTTYRARIMEKMGFSSNVELARYALENGLLI